MRITYHQGDQVVVCTDGTLDTGVVVHPIATGRVHVLFDDGTICSVDPADVHPL